ncbi:MAG: alpha/beta fold hydrolase [Pyrinomonas methylaliphatogenes]|jgi:pimeloyl-ACP methyl ester carboxylesterase|nr:alpha/beta fold hydrolase [Pyrinomonas methylaliphatogenes]
MSEKRGRKWWTGWKGIVAGGAGLATLVTFNAIAKRRRHRTSDPPEEGCPGEIQSYRWEQWNIIYRTAGPASAQPILFIHAILAGSSSYMWRRNIAPLADRFRIYAPDLLGFGFSDKPAVAYTAELYVEQLTSFIRDVIKRPTHIVASSLGAAFAVRLAAERPDLVDSLVLISPTGMTNTHGQPGTASASFYGLLHSPILGASFYNVIASERSLRDYARRYLYYDRNSVTPQLVAHYYAMSHQSGAQHAMAAFFSGSLSCDLHSNFARLSRPVTIIWGREDRNNSAENARLLLALNPRARLVIFDRCRMMVQEEQAERFNSLLHTTLTEKRSAAA